jgi:hypothetical protein
MPRLHSALAVCACAMYCFTLFVFHVPLLMWYLSENTITHHDKAAAVRFANSKSV